MSRKTQAINSVHAANKKLGGARISKMQSKRICFAYIHFCFLHQYPINTIVDSTPESVQLYIRHLQAQGVSAATQHNKLSAIRQAIRALGKNPDEIGISAKNLGLVSRRRTGTKEPITNEALNAAIEKAELMKEHGFVIALKLQRLLGYRGLESLMAIAELENHALDANKIASGNIAITSGTKGGRRRYTQIIHARAAETYAVIREALIYMKEHGFLVSGSKAGLKAARSRYHALAIKVGLVGKYAPHSLRYAYAVEKITELKNLGYNRQEALSSVAGFLGHGASRARYISMVYGKTVVHTVPIEKRKARIDRAINILKNLGDSSL